MDSLSKKLEKLLKDGVEKEVFPGAVLTVALKGELVFHKAVGFSQVFPHQITLEENTIFDMASLTKPLATALAIMRLVSLGMLDLNDTLEVLLPDIELYQKSKLTCWHLLTHCSGLPDWFPFFRSVGAVPLPDRKHNIREAIIRMPLKYKPGSQWLYSDLGFMILEWVVENVSGVPLCEFLAQHVYSKLHLNRTFFQKIDAPLAFDKEDYAATEFCSWREKILVGYVHDENAYAMGGYSGHSGLFSTALDTLQIVNLLLDSYLGRRDDIVSPKVVRSFFTRQNVPPGTTWAIGWDTPTPGQSSSGRFFSRKSVGHLGFTGTSLWVDLERQLVVILLTNRIHPSRKNDKIKQFRPRLHDLVVKEVLRA